MKYEYLEAKTTGKGLVCLWEEYHPQEVRAVIICKPGGEAAVATYVFKPVQVPSNGNRQSIIPVHPGYFVVEGKLVNGKIDIVIRTVLKTFTMPDGTPKVKVYVQNKRENGVWDKVPFERYKNAISAMEEKLTGENVGKNFSHIKAKS